MYFSIKQQFNTVMYIPSVNNQVFIRLQENKKCLESMICNRHKGTNIVYIEASTFMRTYN
jgi:hypothetical protein